MRKLDQSQVIETDKKTGRVSVKTINNEPTKTQQQFKDECDINNIMARYATTGEFLHKTSNIGVYADFSGITDYREMLDTVLYAQEAFASLPAEVRKRFSNDPAQLLNFVQDKNNYDEGVKLGLIHPPQNKTPQTQTNQTTQNNPPQNKTPQTQTNQTTQNNPPQNSTQTQP